MKLIYFSAFAVAAVSLSAAVSGVTPGWDNLEDERKLREPAKLYWQASITNAVEELELAFADGATGRVEYVDGKLLIEKFNSLGYMTVAVKNGFTMPLKTRLRNFLDMEVLRADSEYSFAFARIYDAKKRLHSCWVLDAIGIFMGGGQKMAHLVKTAPGVAERRFSHYQTHAEGGTNLNPVIVVAGAPSLVKVVRWGVEDYDRAQSAWVSERGKRHPRYDHKKELESQGGFARRLAAERDHSARVVKGADGRVTLMVDGEDELPFIYKPPHSWGKKWGDNNGRAMARSGVRLQTLRVGGDLHWKGDKWDRARTIRDIEEQMRCSPDALYIISFATTTPPEYSSANMDEIMRYPDGSPVWGDWGKLRVHNYNDKKKEMPTNCWEWISLSSAKYKADIKSAMCDIIDDLKRTGLAKKVIGIHFCGWHDGQHAPYRPDFSEHARKGFVEFLRAQGRRVADDFKLPVPDKSWWNSADDGGIGHLFTVYQHLIPFRFQEELARAAKRRFGKDIVTLHWAMGVWGGQMNCAHYLEEFCRSDAMDIMVAQPSYIRRLPGCAVGVIAPLESFAHHGKLYVDELDLRAYGLIAGYLKEPSVYGLGHAFDFPMWQAINRRMVGRMFARRQGLWYYDISGGFYNPSEITADIGDAAREGRELLSKRTISTWRPSAAMVVDEKGMLWRNSVGNASCPDMYTLIDVQAELMAGSGVPYETWTAADVLSNPSLLDNAKVVVLGGFLRLDDKRVKFVEKLLDAGKSVVVLSGFADDSWRRFGLAAKERPAMKAPEIVPENGGEYLDYASYSHGQWMRWSLGVRYGDIARINRPPSFSFEENFGGAQTLARYAADSLPAVVRKGNLIAIGQSGGFTAHLFNRLVRDAGGYVPVESANTMQVDMNGDFICVHALATGEFDFKLPFPAKVINLKTSIPAETEGNMLKLNLVAGQTVWFKIVR